MKRMTSNKEPVKSHNNPFIGKIYCTSGTRFQSKESPVCVFWRCAGTFALTADTVPWRHPGRNTGTTLLRSPGNRAIWSCAF